MAEQHPPNSVPMSLADMIALRKAASVLVDNNVGDFVYAIRERELLGWEGPKVKAWGEACATLARLRQEGKL